MSHKKPNNTFHNDALNKLNLATKKGEEPQKGDPFLEEELEEEVNDINELEEEIESVKIDHRTLGELRDEVRELESELKEAKEALLRAHAEMENVRRRAVQDVEKAHKYSTEKFVKELLPVVDSLEKALEIGFDTDSQSLHEGVELTYHLLVKSLEKHGVKVVNPLNEPFDPNRHEAMSMQPDSKVAPNTVINVFQKGYELNGRLIRPALVVVST